MIDHPRKGAFLGNVTHFRILHPLKYLITSLKRLKLETSNFVHGLIMSSISLVMCNCSPSGHGQGHATHFYTLDLENYATASRWCIGLVNKTRRQSASGLHLRRSSKLWMNAQVCYTWSTVTI